MKHLDTGKTYEEKYGKKYTFIEFFAAYAWDKFDDREETARHVEWATEFISTAITEKHFGDCLSISCSCLVCNMELVLEEYYKYFFDEEEWRKEQEL